MSCNSASFVGARRETEWPLVVFTTALQLSCGLAFAATVADVVLRPFGAFLMRGAALAVFPAAALGLLASLFHLGRPFGAWKSLLNLRSSRLSREVLLAGFFAFNALVYSGMWFAQVTDLRIAVGVATSLVGVAAVVSSARIYMLHGQPAWNSGWVPLSFLGGTFLLGGLGSFVPATWAGLAVILRPLLGLAALGALLVLLSAFWMLSHVRRVRQEQIARGQIDPVIERHPSGASICFVLHIALAGILPLAFAVGLLLLARGSVVVFFPNFFLTGLLLAVLLASALGRAIMYSLAGPSGAV